MGPEEKVLEPTQAGAAGVECERDFWRSPFS